MISVHGNKTFPAVIAVCLIAVTIIAGSIAAERNARLRLIDKKYDVVVTELEHQNQIEIAGLME